MKVNVTLYYHTSCVVEVDVDPSEYDSIDELKDAAVAMAEEMSSDEINKELMSNFVSDGDADVEFPDGVSEDEIVLKEQCPFLHAHTMDDGIRELVQCYYGGNLNCKEAGLDIRWTIWDDNIDERTDDNGIVIVLESVFIKYNKLCISWVGGLTESFDTVCVDDEDGNNCGEYIYDQLEPLMSKIVSDWKNNNK